MLLPTEFNQIY